MIFGIDTYSSRFAIIADDGRRDRCQVDIKKYKSTI